MTTATQTIEQLAINTIRTLSMDAVQAANSGHPGTPMALAPVAYTLWNRHLRFDPAQPKWAGRDRFILSCGHASMLLYSTLHVAGVKKEAGSDELAISLEDIKNFRQLNSPCAGHPEFGDAAGIETTTGPLGQGIGNSVGMAAAGKWLAARYDKPDFELFGFDVYTLCSDGDIMEGVGCEAASIAGHLKLSNLCWIYDDNSITIEGRTDLAFTEDVAKRFEGLGWQTVTVEDAEDLAAIDSAIETFKSTNDRPTIIILKSVIAPGSPNKADTSAAHGSPLGEDEIRLTKENYGWDADAKFLVPADVPEHFQNNLGTRGSELTAEWNEKFQAYQAAHPELAQQIQQMQAGELPAGWEDAIPTFEADAKGLATRASSGQVLNAVAQQIPWMLGGSADLAPSNNTMLKFDEAGGSFQAESYGGRNFHYGIREHGMAAAANGMSLAGTRPYVGTFFVFSDYLRPSMRLSSIMHQGVIYVLTHDSIGLGEDGTTHQPVEHLAACRAIPGVLVMRPGDANEVAQCYAAALSETKRPTAMVLTRQNVPTLCRDKYGCAKGARRGGYVVADAEGGQPEVILLATGSELSIALQAHEQLTADGVKARVVSMPCFELFDEQDDDYKESVLPAAVTARVAVEAGIRQGWDAYLGLNGRFVGMDGFGLSAPAGVLYEHFGITAENVAQQAKAAIG